jgi:hypothetical protein
MDMNQDRVLEGNASGDAANCLFVRPDKLAGRHRSSYSHLFVSCTCDDIRGRVAYVTRQATDIDGLRYKKAGKSIFCVSPPRNIWGRDSSVGIAIRYGLDGPGIESLWIRDFPHTSRTVLGPIYPLTEWVPGLFPDGVVDGAWRWPPTPI